MTPTYREMRIDDLPAALEVRLSTVENAITLEELESDYGIMTGHRIDEKTARYWRC